MKRFAFIVNPITIKQLKNFRPFLKIVPDFILRLSPNNISSFKTKHIKKIQSVRGNEIEGYLIVCPLLNRGISNLEDDFVLDKILTAGYIAKQLGAGVIGLGGYASLIADKGYKTISKRLNIPMTSGNALTSWSVFEAIHRLARIKNIDLKKSNLAVIGASDSIGNLCARKFSEYVKRIFIIAKQRDKSEQLKETIQNLNPIELIIEEDAHKIIKDTDIVITTNSQLEDSLEIHQLKPNTIVCNIFPFNNLNNNKKIRRDITVIQGGLIKFPFSDYSGINIGLPRGIVYASMAETILLAFEERYTSYSLGENINLDKLEEIADIAIQHGFEVWVPEAPVL